MKSSIAIITYNRVAVLSAMMAGLARYCRHYPTAIFEDCGQRDGTEAYLIGSPGALAGTPRPDLYATQYQPAGDGPTVFLGDVNLGVAKNSNRALRWFMEESGCDHLCLCNDDLLVLGDFPRFYAKAHKDLGVGLFSFCALTGEAYRWTTQRWRGYGVKICPRLTGAMLSLTREVVEKIGYFDPMFGQFGQEHCDLQNRARIAGLSSLNGVVQPQLDIEHNLLAHQEVESSLSGETRTKADIEAEALINDASHRYRSTSPYRGFSLLYPRFAGGRDGLGVPTPELRGYLKASSLDRPDV